jgi:diguanylate cyclase (GGDEF)-like protein
LKVKIEEILNQVETLWQALEQTWDRATLENLHQKTHQLYREAGIAGKTRLSRLSRNLAIYLYQLIEKDIPQEAPLEQKVEINKQLFILKELVYPVVTAKPVLHHAPVVQVKAGPELDLPKPDGAEFTESNRLIVLIDSNKQEAEAVASNIGHFGYKVEVFPGPDGVIEFIENNRPGTIIIGTEVEKVDPVLFQNLNEKFSKKIPLIFLSNKGDGFSRLQAVKAGGDAYFIKPVDIRELIDKLDSLSTHSLPQAYRILIVDDSATAVTFHSIILQMAGMVTRVATDPEQLMQQLVEFAPDLILMDMYMPTGTGLELAAVIRQQPGYVSVPIVFLSGETNLQKQFQALQLGGDDFLTKPILGDHLVSVVTARVQRSRILRSYIERDSLTGLYNHTRIKEQLELEIIGSRRKNNNLVFAMLDIDYFKKVNDTYGHHIGDRVIKNLSRFLLNKLRRTDFIGRYGGEEFAIILPDISEENGFLVMNRIREDFARFPHYILDTEFYTTFSCGLASFPLYGEANSLSREADRALYEAKRTGRNRVMLAGPPVSERIVSPATPVKR